MDNMKLTQEEIQFIDDYLLKNKVKYWDIRLELVDHIANAVEDKMEKGVSFNEAMLAIHKSFGNKSEKYKLNIENSAWVKETGLYADNSGFKRVLKEKRFSLSKGYRKLFFGRIKTWVTSPLMLLVSILTIVALYAILDALPSNLLGIIMFILILAPGLTALTIGAVRNTKKFRKSLYFITASALSANGFWLGYMLFLVPNTLFEIEFVDFHISYVTIAIVVSSLFTFSGYLLEKEEYQKCKALLQKIESSYS